MKEAIHADELKHSVNLVELIKSKGVSLKKVGKTFVGLCPFHKENKPSFTVDQGKGLWHCFGCDKGGDVFTFLQELEGLTFVQALGELSGGSSGGNGKKSPPAPQSSPARTAGTQELFDRIICYPKICFF